MSIPKVINYCWFGDGKPTKVMEKCIQSWKKYCPDYEIVCWNESNIGTISNLYAQQAMESKKWAFASDYFRLKIIYENGGIYLDTDVELMKSLDELCEKYDGFFGYEDEEYIATGLGFGADKNNRFVKAMLDDYEHISFIDEDGVYDNLPCPKRNTKALLQLGLSPKIKNQVIDGVCFLEKSVLCPMDYYTGKKNITPNTVAIHHYESSWCSDVSKRTNRLKRIIGVRAYDFLYARFLIKSKRWEW